MKREQFRRWASMLAPCIALVCLGTSHAGAAIPGCSGVPADQRWTETECMALEKAGAGDVADIKGKVLTAEFLERLLAGSIKGITVHRHGIRIQRAVVEGVLDLKNAKIPYEVWIIESRFKADLNLRDAIFHRHLIRFIRVWSG